MIMSPTGHDRMCCIAMNYSTMIRYTMSPHGDISIAYIFSCDELGLHLLHVWPLLTPRRASVISDFWLTSLAIYLQTTISFGLLRLAEQLVPCSVPANALVRLDPSPIQSPLHPSSQVRASGRGSDDVVGTRRETCRKLAEGIRGLLGVHLELTERIRGMPRVRQKLVEGKSLLGVCRELAEGDQELARMASGAYRKKTKRLTGRSSGVTKKLTGSQVGLARLDDHIGEID
ncbi:hypothetical protein B296_00009578 [Ensete ventricosum]|uniref:Uncharacterized protein n=1 Tax=Ensete ventricosum TaxID=4639 RepID=A0A426Z9R4_ENSVE|nr:hypothetical protein B296_00009578 [Ensete ventricosum]